MNTSVYIRVCVCVQSIAALNGTLNTNAQL